jgi:hypothetical protein
MLLSASIAHKTPLRKAAKERPMTAPSSPGALAGIKVIDLSRVLGGPFATQLLSDHGADVIKLEPPQGDEVRDWGPPFNENEDASYFIGVNRNKRSVGLDLAQPEGRAVLLRLLEGADVLIENFKPGSMEKWCRALALKAPSADFPVTTPSSAPWPATTVSTAAPRPARCAWASPSSTSPPASVP